MKLGGKLDDLIAENLYPVINNDYAGRSEGAGSIHGRLGTLGTQHGLTIVDKHIDVLEDEGYITIPCKELPDIWNEKSDITSFRSFDRSFVFPGEQVHILASLSTFKQEEYINQADELLIRFKKSHFFARISEADEALWSRRKTDETFGGKFIPVESCKDDVPADRGTLDASTSGGVAKNDVKCCLLANGDIVVLLHVNICVDFLRDPVLEILQFEKYENSGYSEQDPYGDLLKWLLPIHNSASPPRFLSTPEMSPSSSTRNSLSKPNPPSSFGSQNFLLGQFRSHSMSSLSSKSVPPTLLNSNKSGSERNGEGLLSFRGVQLEPERFSVRCGLEGIYTLGRRWRRKIEIIQPLEIDCFSADCNTEDLLCVQIKNVSPANAPDIVLYLDTITVIIEEASKGGPPLSLPIACTEAGSDHGLPNLPLRKGEEHSFILKPSTPLWSSNVYMEKSSQTSQLPTGSARSIVHIFSNVDHGALSSTKYAVLVSCRCNYTESRLLFKQPTNWRPRIRKDIMISVASHMSGHALRADARISNLFVQVLTLEASNLTNEDLKLTLLAPPSLSSSSVVSLTCSPRSPLSPIDDRRNTALQRQRSASKVLNQRCGEGDDHDHTYGSFNEKTIPISDVLPRSDLGRTHMWLKSRVPLGYVPSRSTITFKLELLPLTDGIITLDSLQINVEKGRSYVPEHPLKLNSTSGIRIGAI
uniref:uncharacterized protein LOC122596517 n=1 Tax=Erigeron canadensis TaxID=72917 RepID=UPI001CB8C9F5|nr:uncharacterized protein LOC122596517 [Erigeron canadensis]